MSSRYVVCKSVSVNLVILQIIEGKYKSLLRDRERKKITIL